MIEKSTFDFLKKLKKNNNKEWFDANKSSYKLAYDNFGQFVDEMISQISAFDASMKNLESKQCMFRIYNDVRFAKDKPPYKNHVGAFISKSGKNGVGPGYYFHIEPGNCFMGGGVYGAEGPSLLKVRESIASNSKELRSIVDSKNFKKYFGGLMKDGELKTAPKGFPKDHPAIEFLKLKHYMGTHYFKDDEVLDKKFQAEASKICEAVYPLNKWLNEKLG